MTKPNSTMTHRPRTPRAGFTIIEVLVVVVIIAVIAMIIVPQYFGKVGDAKHSVARQRHATIEQAVGVFQLEYNRLPNDLNEIITGPVDAPAGTNHKSALRASQLLDPWGRPFIYVVPGTHGSFDLYSLGADGQEGGTGENAPITNWD